MHELGLQLLKPRFGLLPFGEIANEAGEEALVAGFHLADCQLHRKRRAVLAFADDHAADTDDAALAGPQVAREIAVMALAIGRGHQHLDIFSDDLRGGVAEQPLRRRAERVHDAALVDDHHGVGDGVENRLKVGRAGERFLGARGGAQPAALQLLAPPRHADADCRKGGGVHQFSLAEIRETGADEETAEHQSERRRQQARTQSAQAGRDQHGGDEEQIGCFVLQDWMERDAGGKGDRDCDRRQAVTREARRPRRSPRRRGPGIGG